jgi:hypothetical protein
MSFSFINFVLVLFAQPQDIAKIRWLQYSMSVAGSGCTFLNAMCVFLLAITLRYSIEHYIKPKVSRTGLLP